VHEPPRAEHRVGWLRDGWAGAACEQETPGGAERPGAGHHL